MVLVSNLYEQIREAVCLSPSASYYLLDILRELDGKCIRNDLKPESKEVGDDE